MMVNKVVVCGNVMQAKIIHDKDKVETISIDLIDTLRGSTKDIVFDKHTLELYPYLHDGLTLYETIELLEDNKPKDLRCSCGHKLAEYTDTEVEIMDKKCKNITKLKIVDGKLKKVIDNIPDKLIAKTPEQFRFNMMVYGTAFIDELK